MTTLALIALLIWVYLLALHGRFWQSGPVLAPEPLAAAPPVTVIVPARDEEAVIGPALRSLLEQEYPGAIRVILVDDGSNDRTGAIARSLNDSRLTVTEARPRPDGWSGKLWAIEQGLATAGSPGTELLVFTDADIVHERRHLATLVRHAERHGLDMVSEMVRLHCESLAERALIPAFVFFFQLLYPFAWVNDPLRRTAAAAGGMILIRRRALDRIGGLASVRGALIDDVALAAAVKRGGRIWLGHSALARSIRSYPSFADISRMVARTAYVQLRFSPWLLSLCIAVMGLTWIVPPLAALFGHHAARWFGFAAWGCMAWSFQPTLRRYGRGWLSGVLLPAIALFYLAATISSAWNYMFGPGVVWKDRAYQGAGA
ncbi:MAG: glycosyltransferase [Acetobacteraceae bacterium]|nr:glycosyltransferase [Acetobacteraceae bacterium]